MAQTTADRRLGLGLKTQLRLESHCGNNLYK